MKRVNLDVSKQSEECSDALLYINNTDNDIIKPIIYVHYDVEDFKSMNVNVIRGWFRRRLAKISIELDRYIGQGYLQERHLYGELLNVEESKEMTEVLDVWQISSLQLDLEIGVLFDKEYISIEDESSIQNGTKVLVHKSLSSDYNEFNEHKKDNDNDINAEMIYGRIKSIEDDIYNIAVTPDGEVVAVKFDDMYIPAPEKPKSDDIVSNREMMVENNQIIENPQELYLQSISNDSMKFDDNDYIIDDNNTNNNFVEYKACEGFSESEAAARQVLAERDRIRLAHPMEKEPDDIDKILYIPEKIINNEVINGKNVKNETEAINVVRKNRVSPGYDLVRVGNFTEKSTSLGG